MSRKFLNVFLGAVLMLAQTSGVLFVNNLPVAAQENKNALFRGYRTGYSDGYMAGYRDSVEKTTRSYQKHKEYASANRAYSANYGAVEDYRDGYQQGFAGGYDTAFDRREFDSTVPATLQRRGTKAAAPVETSKSNAGASAPKPRPTPVAAKSYEPPPTTAVQSFNATNDALIIIPNNTELIVELQSGVGTKESRRGDAFQVRIVAPSEIEGAVIEGRVEELRRPGRIKRRAELQLSFDRIVLSEARWSNLNAMVVESLPDEANPKNNVKNVDPEGVVLGKSSLKTDVGVVGGTTATGAVIGGLAGGPVGVAVGAAVGGAFGLGGVLVARGKDINLAQGQRLRIRTNHETQIR